jgi:hypothetical protein
MYCLLPFLLLFINFSKFIVFSLDLKEQTVLQLKQLSLRAFHAGRIRLIKKELRTSFLQCDAWSLNLWPLVLTALANSKLGYKKLLEC